MLLPSVILMMSLNACTAIFPSHLLTIHPTRIVQLVYIHLTQIAVFNLTTTIADAQESFIRACVHVAPM